jgi:hypothetical protein
MEDWGHCARRAITSKDVTVSSQFESSTLQGGVDVMNNHACRKLRRTPAALAAIETILDPIEMSVLGLLDLTARESMA